MTEVLFKQAVPVLCVLDLDRAIAFYGCLGFALQARFPVGYALLDREGVALHLRVPSAGETITPENNPCGAYFYLHGVDGFADGLREQAIPLLEDPSDRPWGVRECSVSDPGGNLLRFGELRG
jgi:catechol 2,3-dioxygenase-like lactoylglutathione lyase family enzyme